MTDDATTPIARARAARKSAGRSPAQPTPTVAVPTPPAPKVARKPRVAATVRKPAATPPPKAPAPAKAAAKKPAAPRARTRKPAAAPPPVTAPAGSGTTEEAPAPPRVIKAPPEKLSERGRQLWRDLNKVYDFRPDEFVTLEDACHAIARAEALRAELAGMNPMIMGSMGQLVVNPLYTEIRAHEAHVSTLLGKLRLRDVAAQILPKSDRSSSARAKAEQRWTTPHAHGTTS